MSKKEEVVVADDQGMEIMDDTQLVEYAEMVEELGTRAEKITVSSLSTIAEDYSASFQGAAAVYECFKRPLVDASVSSDRKIPIIMAIDSILKNAKGQYIPIIEEDAKKWMPPLYDKLAPGKPRETLERVWKIWREVGIFSESSWKEMGSCFVNNASQHSNFHPDGPKNVRINIINLVPASGPLRRQMQELLDEIQSNVKNELEKVSLERLAEIKPSLLQNIKQEAEKMMMMIRQQSQSTVSAAPESLVPNFFIETRTQFTIDRSKEWMEEWKKPSLKGINVKELVKGIQDMVVNIPSSGALYSQQEAIQMTSSLAAAGATVSSLETAIKSLNDQEQASLDEGTKSTVTAVYSTGVDPKLFTNEGVKKKNPSVIAGLYEVGLPFISSADGRRFKNQTELSNHLDFLFKKNQLEKSMERTEERGWYEDDSIWTGEVSEADLAAKAAIGAVTAMDSLTGNLGETDPESFTVPADENQDRCAVCDLNFKMFFDHDDGIYMYKNCKEITVFLDDAAEKESEQRLVHVTCWKALGSPEELTMDQVLERHASR